MIAVIALLMAILLPSLQRVRKQAKAVVCQANLGQWGKALALYVEDSQGLLPGTGYGRSGTSGTWLLRGAFLSSDGRMEREDSLHHFHTKGVACCPMAVKPNEEGQPILPSVVFVFDGPTVLVEGTAGSTFRAWEITSPAPAFRGSYGFNEWLFNRRSLFFGEPEASVPDRGPSRRPGRGLDIFRLRNRGAIPILLDCGQPSAGPLEETNGPPPLSKWGGQGLHMDSFCMNRHNGHVNGLFLDWSVRKIGLKELWTLKWNYEFNTAGPWTLAGGVQPEDWPKWMRGLKDY